MSGWTDHPPYPVGLRLAGRPVVMVGAGHVAQRRVPALLAAGAVVTVVSPEATPALEALADAGEMTWVRRPFADADLEGAWYVVAATNDPAANAAVSEAADARRIFCARADDAVAATAWTPAAGRHGGATVAVLSDDLENRDPRRVAALRDEIIEALREGVIAAPPLPRADAGRGAGRRGTGRPRADDGRRPEGADGGRRGGGRPAGAARAAGRAAVDDRADRRRQDPARALHRPRRRSTT